MTDRSPVLWKPSPQQVRESEMRRFQAWLKERLGIETSGYGSLHRWSVEHSGEFWAAVWDFYGIEGDRGERLTAVPPGGADSFLFQTRFLPDAELSVAGNLLGAPSDDAAVVYRGENGAAVDLTRAELHDLTARCQQLLLEADVAPGDRVAAWLPNRPEALAVMLAAAGIGAVFCSASPDFGPAGVFDRFSQIQPTVLFGCPEYRYKGRLHDCRERFSVIKSGLPTLRRAVLLEPGWLDELVGAPGGLHANVAESPRGRTAENPRNRAKVFCHRLPFDHPWYVLFSSGTTGMPKCIVHRTGGLLLKHLLEHGLHYDVKPGDRVLQTTSTGWMLWNKMASALACGATLVLYDGSPVWPGPGRMFDLLEETRATLFGTSAKFIDTCRKAGLRPARDNDLSQLRTITTTGSALAPESFDWVYRHAKPDVHLGPHSGGTDLCGSLVIGEPTSPVRRGEMQAPCLGMDMDVVDERGATLPTGAQGELVCRNAFPTMPLEFMNDHDDARYRAAYFERIPGVWHHGDFAMRTPTGGFVISGRSDTTLNPKGVRIGTSEIYRCVNAFDEVAESIAIGQTWQSDTRIVLFVRMAEGCELTDELRGTIRSRIRRDVSPHHVPAVVSAVPDIPRTHTGKLTEIAVRSMVAGHPVENTSAIANPEALQHFRDLPELADEH